jgi:hypothetical protein
MHALHTAHSVPDVGVAGTFWGTTCQLMEQSPLLDQANGSWGRAWLLALFCSSEGSKGSRPANELGLPEPVF